MSSPREIVDLWEFAIVEVPHPHQREGIIQALDGRVVGNHSRRVSRLDRSTY
jgi:hypothetical protein